MVVVVCDFFQILNQGADTWSISELTHALVLMAHFHSLASFVFACGITLEAEQKQNLCHSSSGSTSDQGPFDISGSVSVSLSLNFDYALFCIVLAVTADKSNYICLTLEIGLNN